MRTATLQSLNFDLNDQVTKLKVKEVIFNNYQFKKYNEIFDLLKVELPQLKLMNFSANRIAMGGIIGDDEMINLDIKKSLKLIKSHKTKIVELKNKIKNSASVQQEKKQKEVKLKNTYDNHEGFFKQQAREKMANAMAIPDSPVGVVPTLPSFTCKLESLILEKIGRGISFIGCERDFDTFHKMVNTIAENPILKRTIAPRFGEIGEVIFNAKTDDFAHMILDYCGTVNTFHNEIAYAIQNDLVKVKGTLSITLSKNGIGNNAGIVGELLRQFPEGCFSEEKETEIGVKLFLNKVMKPNYKVETFFNYYDSSPMMLIIIRRIA